MRPRTSLVATAIAASALLAACSAGATPTPAASSAPSPSPAASASPAASPSPAASSAASASPAEGGTVMLADVALGKILVDGQGRTLYLFTKDTSTDSTCYDQCAASWPPLVASGELKPGAGLDDSDFGTTTRTDGTKQVTFYGHPLYYFGGDSKAGDTKGQGLNSVWFVVGAEGNAIKS